MNTIHTLITRITNLFSIPVKFTRSVVHPSGVSRRFLIPSTLSWQYMLLQLGERVHKIALYTNFTRPNHDGIAGIKDTVVAPSAITPQSAPSAAPLLPRLGQRRDERTDRLARYHQVTHDRSTPIRRFSHATAAIDSPATGQRNPEKNGVAFMLYQKRRNHILMAVIGLLVVIALGVAWLLFKILA